MRIQTLAFMASWVYLGAAVGPSTTFDLRLNDVPAHALFSISQPDSSKTSLYLIQVQYAVNETKIPVEVAKRAGKLLDYCIPNSSGDGSNDCGEGATPITIGVQQPIYFDLTPVIPEERSNPQNLYAYVLCFTNKDGWCDPSSLSRSSSFRSEFSGKTVIDGFVQPLADLAAQSPLPIKPGTTTPPSSVPSTTNPDEPAKTIFATTTQAPTTTATNLPTVVVASTSSSKGGGLSTGAKVGIAVGAVAVVLALLILALLFLRKKHRSRTNKKGLMLNQSQNADSRDLITEKEITPTSYQIPNLNFHAPGQPTNETRHLSVLSPYDSPSQPYHGSAASIPRRRETPSISSATAAGATAGTAVEAATIPNEPIAVASPISREVSSASSRHLAPTRSAVSPDPASPTSNYEEYHDVPQYGHVSPQVFQGGLQAPFLSETDSDRAGSVALTEADQARLAEEEEERRIDAAIAESERLKGRGVR